MTKDIEVSKKQRNKRDMALQDIPLEEIKFYIHRQLYTTEQLIKMGENTNFKVLGDPYGRLLGSKNYLLCECRICGFRTNFGMHILKINKIKCDNCFRLRLQKEANQFGLELIAPAASGPHRRLYKFTNCGHTREIATADVRIGHFSCTECSSNDFDIACKRLNISWTGKSSGELREIVFNCCGSTRNVLRPSIMKSTVMCKVCHATELNKFANTIGLQVNKVLPGTYRDCTIISCGHNVKIAISNIRSNHYSCPTCFRIKMEEEASVAGLEYIGTSSKTKHHSYRTPCGHLTTIKPAHVRAGHWTCPVCEKGFVHYPNKLYLFRFTQGEFSWLKFGYSKTPKHRKNDYGLSPGTMSELLMVVEVPTGAIAIELENSIHKRYDHYNYSRTLMKSYMSESGFTECYPLILEHKLIGELNSIKDKFK